MKNRGEATDMLGVEGGGGRMGARGGVLLGKKDRDDRRKS